MKLLIATPIAVFIDVADVAYVRAEDETGSFGILQGHADFLTTLTVSVVTWRGSDGAEHHVAVRGGVLTVHDGDKVEIVTHEAVGEDTLAALGEAVLARMRKEEETEQASRIVGARLELAALRQIQRYLATGSGQLRQGSITGSDIADDFSQGGLE
jgi:F-type H+-transporting ATPase subunit epsilon